MDQTSEKMQINIHNSIYSLLAGNKNLDKNHEHCTKSQEAKYQIDIHDLSSNNITFHEAQASLATGMQAFIIRANSKNIAHYQKSWETWFFS